MPSFDVYPATALQDTAQLHDTLVSAIRNPITHEVVDEDVAETLAAVEAFRTGQSNRYYAVALTAGGSAIGVMGLQEPEPTMLSYATTPRPIELINAYALADERHRGVGSALLSHLEIKAADDGYTELLVNSGPRYMRSGWPFWTKKYGDPIAVAKDYYGHRFDAPVWQKILST